MAGPCRQGSRLSVCRVSPLERMIFVTVGSSRIPFDRLLRAVEKITTEQVVVQHGASRVRPANAECYEFVDHEQFVELARAARAVVTHAGVGSLLTVREAGRRPIVVPRRKAS